jgi:hypothetical protein
MEEPEVKNIIMEKKEEEKKIYIKLKRIKKIRNFGIIL